MLLIFAGVCVAVAGIGFFKTKDSQATWPFFIGGIGLVIGLLDILTS